MEYGLKLPADRSLTRRRNATMERQLFP